MGTDKITRTLKLFKTLLNGETVNKTLFALEHSVSGRSVDRDIEDVRLFLSEVYSGSELLFNKQDNCYYLTGSQKQQMTEAEAMVFAKLLLDSRAFRTDEMKGLLSVLLSTITPEAQSVLQGRIFSEVEHYAPVSHKKAILKTILDLARCIQRENRIVLHYQKATQELVERSVAPVGILFSEFYFYLVAYRNDEHFDHPAFYRVDRIDSFKVLEGHYSQTLKEKGAIGKRKNYLQFMTAGELITVTLRCTTAATEATLDRFPNAQLQGESDGYNIISAKVFDGGLVRWVMGQGSGVLVMEPEKVRNMVETELQKALQLYQY